MQVDHFDDFPSIFHHLRYQYSPSARADSSAASPVTQEAFIANLQIQVILLLVITHIHDRQELAAKPLKKQAMHRAATGIQASARARR
jgi:hypothetical protein